jgi:hypothetical protein
MVFGMEVAPNFWFETNIFMNLLSYEELPRGSSFGKTRQAGHLQQRLVVSHAIYLS